MLSELSWLARLKRTYIGNATATRDLRIQLRGSRAAVLFTIYLIVMTCVLGLVYSESMNRGNGQISLAGAQSNLQSFYYTTLASLAIVITLVAPSMGAFAIVSEKQRRSLDLVFSAPTEPKYYLVGKLISAYRYVWMLLVLSLPFCAVSVTLGGTTWGQLFITFLMYSFYGMVCVSLGLLLSTLCSKVLPAIIWTYAALACYLLATLPLLALNGFGGSSSSPFGQISPFSTLNPATYSFIADQSWPVFGREIPTWILSILLHLVIVKLIVLAAGSLLAPGSSKEIRGLRVHGLIYTGAITYLIGLNIDPIFRGMMLSGVTSGRVSATERIQMIHGRTLFGLLFLLGLMVVPYLASFGFNDLRRHRPDGLFKIKQIFTGRPSGHLPYLLLLFFTCVVTYLWGVVSGSSTSISGLFGVSRGSMGIPIGAVTTLQLTSLDFWMYVLLALDLWIIAFFVGWFIVGKKPILSRGRTYSLFFFVLCLILPTALFAIVAPEDARSGTGIWLVNPIAGVVSDFEFSRIAGPQALALVCICVILIAVTMPLVAKQSSINLERAPEANHDSNEKIPTV